MSRRQPPNPSNFRSMTEWAIQMYEYILSTAAVSEKADPLPILLARKFGALDLRAAEDGIFAYDPNYETPITSINGAWEPTRSTPQFQLHYHEAYNVAGAAITTSGMKIPFAASHLVSAPWATFNSVTTDFDLIQGSYYIEGWVTITKASGGAQTAYGYLAKSSDLTTPVGDVIMGSVSIPSSAPNDTTLVVPFRGHVDVAATDTYAMVVNTQSANLQLGAPHNLVGFENTYAALEISLIGLNGA